MSYPSRHPLMTDHYFQRWEHNSIFSTIWNRFKQVKVQNHNLNDMITLNYINIRICLGMQIQQKSWGAIAISETNVNTWIFYFAWWTITFLKASVNLAMTPSFKLYLFSKFKHLNQKVTFISECRLPVSVYTVKPFHPLIKIIICIIKSYIPIVLEEILFSYISEDNSQT